MLPIKTHLTRLFIYCQQTKHNLEKLRENGQAVAEIRAVHSGPRAHCATSEDAGGLEPVAQDARVMLSSNLWVEAGLVGYSKGNLLQSCGPPHLPTAVVVGFDYTMHDGIVPIRRSWTTGEATCSRLQLPLKLAWVVTIHKAQGLTLSKAVGSKEFCTGLTFVACSRVRSLADLMFNAGFDFDRISNMANSVRFQERRTEDAKLQSLHENGLN